MALCVKGKRAGLARRHQLIREPYEMDGSEGLGMLNKKPAQGGKKYQG
jgi:hypothetical protein